MLAGAIDFGGVLYAKFNLDDAVAAASNFSLLNAASVNSTNGAALASNVATIAGNGYAVRWADATVVVNNGPTAVMTDRGAGHQRHGVGGR